jgi:hypothetical protein
MGKAVGRAGKAVDEGTKSDTAGAANKVEKSRDNTAPPQ